eukprot:1290219-Rhodomonas_salina.3
MELHSQIGCSRRRLNSQMTWTLIHYSVIRNMIIKSIRESYSAMDLFSITASMMISLWGWNELFVTSFKTILFKPGNNIMEAHVAKFSAHQ